jgi:hypothetical protein
MVVDLAHDRNSPAHAVIESIGWVSPENVIPVGLRVQTRRVTQSGLSGRTSKADTGVSRRRGKAVLPVVKIINHAST